MSQIQLATLRTQLRRRFKQIKLCPCEGCVHETLEVMRRNEGIYIVVDRGQHLERCLREPCPHVDLKKWIKTRKKK